MCYHILVAAVQSLSRVWFFVIPWTLYFKTLVISFIIIITWGVFWTTYQRFQYALGVRGPRPPVLRNSCLLICLIIAGWAAWFVTAQLHAYSLLIAWFVSAQLFEYCLLRSLFGRHLLGPAPADPGYSRKRWPRRLEGLLNKEKALLKVLERKIYTAAKII